MTHRLGDGHSLVYIVHLQQTPHGYLTTCRGTFQLVCWSMFPGLLTTGRNKNLSLCSSSTFQSDTTLPACKSLNPSLPCRSECCGMRCVGTKLFSGVGVVSSHYWFPSSTVRQINVLTHSSTDFTSLHSNGGFDLPSIHLSKITAVLKPCWEDVPSHYIFLSITSVLTTTPYSLLCIIYVTAKNMYIHLHILILYTSV